MITCFPDKDLFPMAKPFGLVSYLVMRNFGHIQSEGFLQGFQKNPKKTKNNSWPTIIICVCIHFLFNLLVFGYMLNVVQLGKVAVQIHNKIQ